jgi:hypothetical protein
MSHETILPEKPLPRQPNLPRVRAGPGMGPEGRGTRCKCAKRTQFPTTRGDEAWGAGAVGQSCETKPIRNKSGEDAQSTKRQLCETKPNLGWLRYQGHGKLGRGADCAKRTQFRGRAGWDGARGARDEGQMRKTNPISPAGRHPEANRAKRTQFPATPGTRPAGRRAGPIVRNEANLGQPGWGPGADCAKQTQFGADGQGRPSSRPKALALPPIGGNCAEQSQFPPDRIPHRSTHYSSIPTRCRLCKTKPISAGRDTPPFHYSIIPVFQPAGPRTLRRMPASPALGIAEKADAAWGCLC